MIDHDITDITYNDNDITASGILSSFHPLCHRMDVLIIAAVSFVKLLLSS